MYTSDRSFPDKSFGSASSSTSRLLSRAPILRPTIPCKVLLSQVSRICEAYLKIENVYFLFNNIGFCFLIYIFSSVWVTFEYRLGFSSFVLLFVFMFAYLFFLGYEYRLGYVRRLCYKIDFALSMIILYIYF